MEIITKTLDKFIDIKSDEFIFDIETTGLNSKYNKIILIGIVYNENNNTIIKQFFTNNSGEERDLLIEFRNFALSFNKHISFNGINFDIPFLNYRLQKHDINFSLNKNDDIDILKLIKPFKEKLALSDCKLKTIEKYLEIYRDDTISGKESVDLYKEFEKTQDENLKHKILLHNYDDIYYLGIIYNKLDLIQSKLNPLTTNFNGTKISLISTSFKFIKDTLIVEYTDFHNNLLPINIYKSSYSIVSSKNSLKLTLSVESGVDNDKNNIIFFRMNKLIILKVDNTIIDKNIFTLSNFLIKHHLSNINL